MAYTPRSRDRFKSLVALLTGAATFTSVAAVGAAAGSAAHETALRDQAREQKQAELDAAARAAALRQAQQGTPPGVVTVLRQRPQRTVVRTRVLHQTSQPGVATVGPGGTISRPSYTVPSTSGSSAPPRTAPAPAPLPVPVPVPAPMPAPTSGS